MFRAIRIVGTIVSFLVGSIGTLHRMDKQGQVDPVAVEEESTQMVRNIFEKLLKMAGVTVEVRGYENIPQDRPVVSHIEHRAILRNIFISAHLYRHTCHFEQFFKNITHHLGAFFLHCDRIYLSLFIHTVQCADGTNKEADDRSYYPYRAKHTDTSLFSCICPKPSGFYPAIFIFRQTALLSHYIERSRVLQDFPCKTSCLSLLFMDSQSPSFR